MELADYFTQVSLQFEDLLKLDNPQARLFTIDHLDAQTTINSLGQYDIAILGMTEFGEAAEFSTKASPDRVRDYLYQLFKPSEKVKLIDLGNLKQGNTLADAYSSLQYVLETIIAQGVVVLLLGGPEHFTYAIDAAYHKLMPLYNLVSVNSVLPICVNKQSVKDDKYLSKILNNGTSNIFQFSNIGYQTYFVGQQVLEHVDRLDFEAIRLGEVRGKIALAEPVIRDANVLNISLNAIKQADAPATSNPSPNGFCAYEACQMAWYGGVSDKLSTFGVFDILNDCDGQTAHLAAQIVWSFIDGYANRKDDDPIVQHEKFLKFLVPQKHLTQDLVFYKSSASDRWWVEVPSKAIVEGKMVIACSFIDYQRACNHELPERWLKTFQKIN